MMSALPRSLALLLAVAVLAAAAVFFVTEVSYQRSSESLSGLSRRFAARIDAGTVLRRMVDAETAQRGYLITGRPEYLAPREEVALDLAAAFRRLEAHYADDPRLLAAVKAMRDRVDEKLSEVAATVSLYDQGQHERWRDLVMTDIGREKMEAVRRAAEVLMVDEDRNVTLESNSVFRVLGQNRVGVHLLNLLAMLALGLYVRKTLALQAERSRHANDLQAERDELDATVQRRTLELTALAQHLQTAREDERNRLARDLHDELGALLTAAKLDVARLKRGIGVMAPEVEQRVRHLVSTIDQGIALKRRIIEDLRPSSLSNLGLVAALDIQAREFAERSGLKVQTRLEALALPEASQLTVYRLVQESLTNAAKYAAASEVQINLDADGCEAHVSVRDNGKGFDTLTTPHSAHGLMGMRYRVEAAHGRLNVQSTRGSGTCIEAWLPLLPVEVADSPVPG